MMETEKAGKDINENREKEGPSKILPCGCYE